MGVKIGNIDISNAYHGGSSVSKIYRGNDLIWPDAEPFITFPVLSSINPKATIFDVNIQSNVDWQVEESSSWVTVSPYQGSGNATLTFTVTENMNVLQNRTANIVVRSRNLLPEIQVPRTLNQLGKAKEVTNITFDSTKQQACGASPSISYFINDDSFEMASKIFTDANRENLAPAGWYSEFGQNFVRHWQNTIFIENTNCF